MCEVQLAVRVLRAIAHPYGRSLGCNNFGRAQAAAPTRLHTANPNRFSDGISTKLDFLARWRTQSIRESRRRLDSLRPTSEPLQLPYDSAQTGAAGFALADSLTALAILSVTITLAIGAVNTARKLALDVVETRQAATSLSYLMDLPLPFIGSKAGMDNGKSWALSLQPTSQTRLGGGVTLCHRVAQIQSLKTRRSYAADRLEVCPPQRQI
jgi:hypothetical protein